MKKILLLIVVSFFFYTGFSQTDAFLTKWEIKSNNLNLTFPALNGTYDIDWGDGTTNTGVTSAITHTFNQAGDYSVKITGTFTRINFSGKTQLVDLKQWGTNKWKYISFSECTSLKAFTATDIPDLTNVVSTSRMFYKASSFNGDVSTWDVSSVTNMSGMFSYASSFDGDLSTWDVSNVTTMSGMFSGVNRFNQDIGNWDVSSVKNMSGMFYDANRFNQNIGNWDVSSVTNMEKMFSGANRFNQDIGNWDVSNVTNMKRMFYDASSFNSDLSNWDVSSVTNMSHMFFEASKFNQNIGNWDVSNVTITSGMFFEANRFNQDIGNWDVSNVTDMSYMFGGASSFNSDISNWDVSNVTDMFGMFHHASSFNGDISNWDVTYVSSMNNMFYGVKLSTENYDALLEGWSKLDLSYGVLFSGGYSTYCSGEAARQKMIDDFGWKITDGGRDSECTLGVDDELLEAGLKMYPNPATNTLAFESKLPVEKVEIYSQTGQKIKEFGKNIHTISTENLSKGVYFIKIYSDKGVAVRKIIKQ